MMKKSRLREIIREEIHTSSILLETYEDDLKKLKSMGYSVKDELKSGPYTIVLLTMFEQMYQIALSSNNEEFTSNKSQEQRPTKQSNEEILKAWKQVIVRVKEWLNKYKIIYVGTFNENRAKKYKRILDREGFKTTEIEEKIPGSWIFTIEK